MKRKAYQQLLDWKSKGVNKPALRIEGARGIGKSFIVKEFAKYEYKSHIVLDFNCFDKDLNYLFELCCTDLEEFYYHLSVHYDTPLYEGNSVIIFDEIQQHPRAIPAIKHLVDDGSYDIIVIYSLESVRNNIPEFMIPYRSETLYMYPMDFEEFLWAFEETTILEEIKNHFAELKPLGRKLHAEVMELVKQYMIIGGFPEAIVEYCQSDDFNKVDAVKRDILYMHRKDILFFTYEMEQKISRIFEIMPVLLKQEKKKIRVSAISADARMREYKDAISWLVNAHIINPCYNVLEPTQNIEINTDRLTIKCYMNDTGLLFSHAFTEQEIEKHTIYKKIMLGDTEMLNGMFIENLAAQMLQASGHQLYFYSTPTERKGPLRMELDFLLKAQSDKSPHSMTPIEVKTGARCFHKSIDKFKNKFSENITKPYIFYTNDLKIEQGNVFLPIYMAPFL